MRVKIKAAFYRVYNGTDALDYSLWQSVIVYHNNGVPAQCVLIHTCRYFVHRKINILYQHDHRIIVRPGGATWKNLTTALSMVHPQRPHTAFINLICSTALTKPKQTFKFWSFDNRTYVGHHHHNTEQVLKYIKLRHKKQNIMWQWGCSFRCWPWT